MIPKSTLNDLIGKQVKVYLMHLPDPHCMQKGKIDAVTEHLLILNDEAHTDLLYIPLENIVFVKKL